MLKFSEDDFNEILKDSEKLETKIPAKVYNQFLYNWLPSAISNKYQDQKDNEFVIVEEGVVVKANAFIDVNKSPLVNGDAIAFKNERIILLNLYTM